MHRARTRVLVPPEWSTNSEATKLYAPSSEPSLRERVSQLVSAQAVSQSADRAPSNPTRPVDVNSRNVPTRTAGTEPAPSPAPEPASAVTHQVLYPPPLPPYVPLRSAWPEPAIVDLVKQQALYPTDVNLQLGRSAESGDAVVERWAGLLQAISEQSQTNITANPGSASFRFMQMLSELCAGSASGSMGTGAGLTAAAAADAASGPPLRRLTPGTSGPAAAWAGAPQQRAADPPAPALALASAAHRRSSPPQLEATPLGPPAALVGFEGDWLAVQPTILPCWDKVSLEPCGSLKAAEYYVVCAEQHASAARMFVKDVSAAFLAMRLGTHSAGRTPAHLQAIDGVIPVPLDPGPLGLQGAGAAGGLAPGTDPAADPAAAAAAGWPSLARRLLDPAVQRSAILGFRSNHATSSASGAEGGWGPEGPCYRPRRTRPAPAGATADVSAASAGTLGMHFHQSQQQQQPSFQQYYWRNLRHVGRQLQRHLLLQPRGAAQEQQQLQQQRQRERALQARKDAGRGGTAAAVGGGGIGGAGTGLAGASTAVGPSLSTLDGSGLVSAGSCAASDLASGFDGDRRQRQVGQQQQQQAAEGQQQQQTADVLGPLGCPALVVYVVPPSDHAADVARALLEVCACLAPVTPAARGPAAPAPLAANDGGADGGTVSGDGEGERAEAAAATAVEGGPEGAPAAAPLPPLLGTAEAGAAAHGCCPGSQGQGRGSGSASSSSGTLPSSCGAAAAAAARAGGGSAASTPPEQPASAGGGLVPAPSLPPGCASSSGFGDAGDPALLARLGGAARHLYRIVPHWPGGSSSAAGAGVLGGAGAGSSSAASSASSSSSCANTAALSCPQLDLNQLSAMEIAVQVVLPSSLQDITGASVRATACAAYSKLCLHQAAYGAAAAVTGTAAPASGSGSGAPAGAAGASSSESPTLAPSPAPAPATAAASPWLLPSNPHNARPHSLSQSHTDITPALAWDTCGGAPAPLLAAGTGGGRPDGDGEEEAPGGHNPGRPPGADLRSAGAVTSSCSGRSPLYEPLVALAPPAAWLLRATAAGAAAAAAAATAAVAASACSAESSGGRVWLPLPPPPPLPGAAPGPPRDGVGDASSPARAALSPARHASSPMRPAASQGGGLTSSDPAGTAVLLGYSGAGVAQATGVQFPASQQQQQQQQLREVEEAEAEGAAASAAGTAAAEPSRSPPPTLHCCYAWQCCDPPPGLGPSTGTGMDTGTAEPPSDSSRGRNHTGPTGGGSDAAVSGAEVACGSGSGSGSGSDGALRWDQPGWRRCWLAMAFCDVEGRMLDARAVELCGRDPAGAATTTTIVNRGTSVCTRATTAAGASTGTTTGTAAEGEVAGGAASASMLLPGPCGCGPGSSCGGGAGGAAGNGRCGGPRAVEAGGHAGGRGEGCAAGGFGRGGGGVPGVWHTGTLDALVCRTVLGHARLLRRQLGGMYGNDGSGAGAGAGAREPAGDEAAAAGTTATLAPVTAAAAGEAGSTGSGRASNLGAGAMAPGEGGGVVVVAKLGPPTAAEAAEWRALASRSGTANVSVAAADDAGDDPAAPDDVSAAADASAEVSLVWLEPHPAVAAHPGSCRLPPGAGYALTYPGAQRSESRTLLQGPPQPLGASVPLSGGHRGATQGLSGVRPSAIGNRPDLRSSRSGSGGTSSSSGRGRGPGAVAQRPLCGLRLPVTLVALPSQQPPSATSAAAEGLSRQLRLLSVHPWPHAGGRGRNGAGAGRDSGGTAGPDDAFAEGTTATAAGTGGARLGRKRSAPEDDPAGAMAAGAADGGAVIADRGHATETASAAAADPAPPPAAPTGRQAPQKRSRWGERVDLPPGAKPGAGAAAAGADRTARGGFGSGTAGSFAPQAKLAAAASRGAAAVAGSTDGDDGSDSGGGGGGEGGDPSWATCRELYRLCVLRDCFVAAQSGSRGGPSAGRSRNRAGAGGALGPAGAWGRGWGGGAADGGGGRDAALLPLHAAVCQRLLGVLTACDWLAMGDAQ